VCTLTWAWSADGYELFFNRDEQRTRAAALPPSVHERGGTRWIAPTDPDGGGTWLGVNEHGVAIGVLNGYRRANLALGELSSRGALVSSLLDVASLDELGERLARADLRRFRSFGMVAFDPARRARIAEWDGERLELRALDDARRPLCSSSLDPLGAGASRRKLYAEMVESTGELDTALLERFHASHAPDRGALSPCMHREDAQTVSYSRVVVARAELEFHYSPAAPCIGAPRTLTRLERRTSRSAARAR
jgi:hypothetical protein